MGCKWGETCYQDHGNPNSVEFCPQFRSVWGCQWYDECWFRHVEFTDPRSALSPSKRTGKGVDDRNANEDEKATSSADTDSVSHRDLGPLTPDIDGKEKEMETVYKQSPDRKSNITTTTVTTAATDDDEKQDLCASAGSPAAKRRETAFSKLDDSLAAYYEDMGRDDYYDEDGKGKFIEFVEINGFDEDQMEDQLGHNVEAMECLYLEMDENFPLKNSYKTTEQRNVAIFNVLQDCYRLGRKSRSQSPKHPKVSPRVCLSPLSKLKADHVEKRNIKRSTPKWSSSKKKKSPTPIHIPLKRTKCTDLETKKEGCSLLNRMISTLRHYSKIDVSNDAKDKAEFINFMNRNAANLLGDYQHIMEQHPPSDVELIQKLKSAEFQLFNACDTNNCLSLMLVAKQKEKEEVCPAFGSASGCKWGKGCTKSHSNPNSVKLCDNFLKPEGCPFGSGCYFRHRTWPDPERDAKRGDETFVFYRDLMDSMHCYLIHSHDVQYRIKVRHRMKVEDQRMDEAKWKIWGDDKFRFKSKVQCGMHEVFIFKGSKYSSRSDRD